MSGGLPAELQFPVFIVGDGGSGRTSALGEIARRAAVDQRVMITFSSKDHLSAGASAAQRDGLARWFANYIESVARQAARRIIVLIDDIDCFDHEQITHLLSTTAAADLAFTSNAHFLARHEGIWNRCDGSVVTLRTQTPALCARLDEECIPIGRELLAGLAAGESFQVDLATRRVSSLTWPWRSALDV